MMARYAIRHTSTKPGDHPEVWMMNPHRRVAYSPYPRPLWTDDRSKAHTYANRSTAERHCPPTAEVVEVES